MESNWRWNVYDVGMWGSDWRLCARVQPGTSYGAYWIARRGDPERVSVYDIAPGQLPVYLLDVYIGRHFPGPFIVLPD